ncbi:MAG: shikimate kinase [Nitrososphaerota archaeon]
MIGKATVHGAVSIVNGAICGKGVSLGVDLRTTATVEITEDGRWNLTSNNTQRESMLLVNTVKNVLGIHKNKFGATINVTTEIPEGVGLKSSSSSSVAVALATMAALGHDSYDEKSILNISADASLESGVSITGAIDDATACLLGNACFCDNMKRIVMQIKEVGSYHVLIKVPICKRKKIDVQYMRLFSREAETIFDIAYRKDIWVAMTMNGLLCSIIFGYDTNPSMQAIECGALAAGLSGLGPSVAAIFDDNNENLRRLKSIWAKDGSRVIECRTSSKKGEMMTVE